MSINKTSNTNQLKEIDMKNLIVLTALIMMTFAAQAQSTSESGQVQKRDSATKPFTLPPIRPHDKPRFDVVDHPTKPKEKPTKKVTDRKRKKRVETKKDVRVKSKDQDNSKRIKAARLKKARSNAARIKKARSNAARIKAARLKKARSNAARIKKARSNAARIKKARSNAARIKAARLSSTSNQNTDFRK